MTELPAAPKRAAASGSRQTEASGPCPGRVVPIDSRYGGTRSLIRSAPQAADITSSRAPARRLVPADNVEYPSASYSTPEYNSETGTAGSDRQRVFRSTSSFSDAPTPSTSYASAEALTLASESSTVSRVALSSGNDSDGSSTARPRERPVLPSEGGSRMSVTSVRPEPPGPRRSAPTARPRRSARSAQAWWLPRSPTPPRAVPRD